MESMRAGGARFLLRVGLIGTGAAHCTGTACLINIIPVLLERRRSYREGTIEAMREGVRNNARHE
jgi:hypothetical protein